MALEGCLVDEFRQNVGNVLLPVDFADGEALQSNCLLKPQRTSFEVPDFANAPPHTDADGA